MIYDLYDLLVNLNNTTIISLIVQDGQIVISNFWSSLYNLKNLMNSENLVHSIYIKGTKVCQNLWYIEWRVNWKTIGKIQSM